jgi:hypothetical protein
MSDDLIRNRAVTHLDHYLVQSLHEREERAQGNADEHRRAPLNRLREVEQRDEERE